MPPQGLDEAPCAGRGRSSREGELFAQRTRFPLSEGATGAAARFESEERREPRCLMAEARVTPGPEPRSPPVPSPRNLHLCDLGTQHRGSKCPALLTGPPMGVSARARAYVCAHVRVRAHVCACAHPCACALGERRCSTQGHALSTRFRLDARGLAVTSRDLTGRVSETVNVDEPENATRGDGRTGCTRTVPLGKRSLGVDAKGANPSANGKTTPGPRAPRGGRGPREALTPLAGGAPTVPRHGGV